MISNIGLPGLLLLVHVFGSGGNPLPPTLFTVFVAHSVSVGVAN